MVIDTMLVTILVILTYNISHKLLRPIPFLGKFMDIRNGPICKNKSGPFSLLNFAAYWKSSKTKACAKTLSQILHTTLIIGGGGSLSEFK